MTDGVYDPNEWLTPAERAAAEARWNAPDGEGGEFAALMRRWGEQQGILPRQPHLSAADEKQHLLALAYKIRDLVNAGRQRGQPNIDAWSVLAYLRKERRPDKETARVVAQVADQVGWPADGVLFCKGLAGMPF